MNVLKKGLFSILFSLKSFFYLSYPMLQLLCSLGIGIGLLLSVSSSDVKESSNIITVVFMLFSLSLVLFKQYYRKVLIWSDLRSNNIVYLN
ncbi:hypothetical protein C9J47_00570 [Photobacterium indicum]|uniref:Uncharacterized protein n=1 Tax=Photobacterium indicum TaxID=81447 RepID=A0A2T3LCI8_9GAMM|nr:hypothetical protein C9J47_00570 [Photobacterium indicum]